VDVASSWGSLSWTVLRVFRVFVVRCFRGELTAPPLGLKTPPACGELRHFPIEQRLCALDAVPVPIMVEAPEGAVFFELHFPAGGPGGDGIMANMIGETKAQGVHEDLCQGGRTIACHSVQAKGAIMPVPTT